MEIITIASDKNWSLYVVVNLIKIKDRYPATIPINNAYEPVIESLLLYELRYNRIIIEISDIINPISK